MDVLSAILEPLRVRGSVFCHGPVRAPWSFEGGAAGRCLFHCVVEGGAWVSTASGTSRRVGVGDVVLLPHGGAHRMGSEADLPSVPLGRAVAPATADSPFARFRIGGDGAPAELICGSFQVDGMTWHPLMRALPELLVVNVGVARWLSPTLSALERYVGGAEPGAELITQRLTEILFVQALSAWLAQDDALPTGWLRALGDPHLQRALGGLHASPARDWSVEALAREAGLSRSAFFSRFRDVVGETPARYLVSWRMTLAARALREEELSVGEVCARVGYGSVPSFTHAFRAHFGQTPAAYRRASRDGDAGPAATGALGRAG